MQSLPCVSLRAYGAANIKRRIECISNIEPDIYCVTTSNGFLKRLRTIFIENFIRLETNEANRARSFIPRI